MSNDTSDGKKTGGGGNPAQRKESSVELQKMMDSLVLVKCLGGRELKGILRGFDDLFNLVLDDSEEYLRGMLQKFDTFISLSMLHLITSKIDFLPFRSGNTSCHRKDTETWSGCYQRNPSIFGLPTRRGRRNRKPVSSH
jgi:small nuclear ribonucleoprotein (snRNP)-like protein